MDTCMNTETDKNIRRCVKMLNRELEGRYTQVFSALLGG